MAGEKETFTASVTYNTEDLYGKVEASWKITVEPGKGGDAGRIGSSGATESAPGQTSGEGRKGPGKGGRESPGQEDG